MGLAKASGWRTPGEPAQVCRLIEHPFNHRNLWHIAQRHLPGVGGKLLVSSLFIHQKPKVRFKTNHRVELGDVLFARQHFVDGSPIPQNRAFLLQAKAAPAPRTGILRGNELQQFLLYSNWGRQFVFPFGELGDPPDGSKYWDLSKGPTTPQADTGFYGLVSSQRLTELAPDYPEGCAWAATAAKAGVLPPSVDASTTSFAELLEGFLRGTRGRAWFSAPMAGDHWSHLVQGLLQAAVTHEWRYPIIRLGANELPRHRNLLYFVDQFIDGSAIYPSHIAVGQGLHEARERWRKTVNLPPPGEPEREEEPPRRGALSVVYVASFGDRPLSEGDREYEPRPNRS